MKMASTTLTSFFFIFLLLLTAHASVLAAANPSSNPSEAFLRCFLQKTDSSSIYAPNTTAYNTTFRSSVQNIRFLSPATTKPALVVLPAGLADVQAAVACGRRHGLRLRVRSGGHDYEGLSYVSAGDPFVILDFSQLRSVTVDAAAGTAWVGAGATVGEVYYHIAAQNSTAGFPASICLTVGVGGLFSGGGIGTLMRKHGLSSDNIVDAVMVDASGAVLDRESMGEDLFWAVRGGGAASFGVVLYYKIRLVYVPPKVTVLAINRTLEQGATKLVEKWQRVAPGLVDDLLIRVVVMAMNDTIQTSFQGLFLGRQDDLLSVMNESFPELGTEAEDLTEVSWVESTLLFANYPSMNSTILLDRRPVYNSSFKAKSDFVREPITEEGWEGIWKFMVEGKEKGESLQMIMEPWGGRLDEIGDADIAFPHRKGNLFNIQYFMRWFETEEAVTKRHLGWMKGMYEFMAPHVSSNPRAAYVNYRDIDLGSSGEMGRTNYSEASSWGRNYFLGNFERLAKVKAKVDPENYFWNEQGIPPFS